ncbi:uncharacterized protein LOC130936013 [Arachis stenosperma]|uniref:uncharacterized protein LOC130936013 n=1 Tax=Arachis stenosperma TaxID=217475 RepID=UPI0025AD34D2|nr:uncharacterized protein LOC130936013 [Arachis stenosperma]
MEVMVQNSSSMDNFEFMSGTMSSPYLSAPSSPKRFGEYYLSAPTSPSRVSELYADFHEYFSSSSSSSTMHFQQGITTNNNEDDGNGDDEDDDEGFAFFVSRESEKPSRSAEELFDGGKIKLLEPKGNELFIKTHEKEEEEKERNILFKAFSKKKEANESHQETQQRRGRDRTPASSSTLSSSNSGRRITRSHSPYRTPFQEQQQQPPLTNKLESSSILASSSSSSNNNNKGGSSSKRWSIKDLLLFRSASEGRASTKDQFKNILYNKSINKTSSFRSIDSSSRKKGHVSPHELHYAMKRAESEDMKKKTYLPYKHGILGRLAGFGL